MSRASAGTIEPKNATAQTARTGSESIRSVLQPRSGEETADVAHAEAIYPSCQKDAPRMAAGDTGERCRHDRMFGGTFSFAWRWVDDQEAVMASRLDIRPAAGCRLTSGGPSAQRRRKRGGRFYRRSGRTLSGRAATGDIAAAIRLATRSLATRSGSSAQSRWRGACSAPAVPVRL